MKKQRIAGTLCIFSVGSSTLDKFIKLQRGALALAQGLQRICPSSRPSVKESERVRNHEVNVHRSIVGLAATGPRELQKRRKPRRHEAAAGLDREPTEGDEISQCLNIALAIAKKAFFKRTL